jgi:polyhydroxyalkanoate synthase subunit PhaE
MENQNMFNTFANMQKQAVETFNQAAESMKNAMGNPANVDFNSDFFKKWYDSQMAWFNHHKGENNNQAFEFFQNWMNSQTDIAKKWFEASQGLMNNMPAMDMNNTNWNANYSNMMNMFNSWKETMTSSYNEMMTNFNNGTNKETFSGMFNNADMYMKMFQFWMPMMKSLQDKSFTTESFRQMFNAPMYKDMMDKMFNMQPDFMKNMFNSNMGGMKDQMGNMMDMNKNMFDNMKNMMSQNMNTMMPADMFTSMLNNYNSMFTQMNNATAPLAKLMPNGNQKQQMEMMKELTNHMNVYNLKNTQMQYMMYATGMQAMDEVSENLYSKMRNGEDFNSFINVYQEWLNTNDKHFVALFESDEYSKLMSEVSALQLGLKKKIENQMEKAFSNLPLINRSEMDELYLTIQGLKSRISMLENQIDAETSNETEVEVKETKTRKGTKANA